MYVYCRGQLNKEIQMYLLAEQISSGDRKQWNIAINTQLLSGAHAHCIAVHYPQTSVMLTRPRLRDLPYNLLASLTCAIITLHLQI